MNARNMRLNKLITIAVTVTVLVAACSDSQEDVVAPAGDTEAGEQLYAENCAACHGVDLRGTDLGPSHLSFVYEPNHHGDNAFRAAIANGSPQHHWGFGDMQPVLGLSSSDVDSIVAYVRKQQRTWGFD